MTDSREEGFSTILDRFDITAQSRTWIEFLSDSEMFQRSLKITAVYLQPTERDSGVDLRIRHRKRARKIEFRLPEIIFLLINFPEQQKPRSVKGISRCQFLQTFPGNFNFARRPGQTRLRHHQLLLFFRLEIFRQ